MISVQTASKPNGGRIGQSAWFDLPVADLADAMSFYSGLLHWTFRQMDASPLNDYAMIEAGGELIGGLRKVSVGHTAHAADATAPVLYFTVDTLAPKVARAKELGAEIVGTAVDLGPGRGRYQWIRDRAGHLIGLWGPE